MKQADIKPPFAALGMEPVGEGPEEFAQAAASEIVSITKIVESAGLKPK
jgi:tripartite-type tricarboxylate transporter receptor subunit TctC